MEYTTINGVEVSRIGLGTWAIGGTEWGAVEESDAVRTCLAALDHGINLIDTAPIYGHGRAESILGKAMQEHGRREDFYIATKCGLEWDAPEQPGAVITNSTSERIERELSDSLQRLGTSYIDLYQVHWPDPLVLMEEVALLFARFLAQGRIRAIGVSNFHPDRLMDIKAFNEIAPAVNQVEVNPFHQQAQSVAFMKDNGVQPEAWAPFAEGRNNLFHNEVLTAIAGKHGKSVGQVVLRWLVQRGIVALAKSVRKERMAENINVFDFQLDEDDIARIGTLETGTSSFFSHRDPAMVKWMSERRLDI